LVEQRIENPRVGGSIPPLATSTNFQDVPQRPRTSEKPLRINALGLFCFRDGVMASDDFRPFLE